MSTAQELQKTMASKSADDLAAFARNRNLSRQARTAAITEMNRRLAS